MKTLSRLFLAVLLLTSCKGTNMTPIYPKSAVEIVNVAKVSDAEIQLDYKVLPGTMLFSMGVNYEMLSDRVNVYIDQCRLRQPCTPMSASINPNLKEDWTVKVKIPNNQKPVFIIHSDGLQQIYP
jgi:hypothetical protein